MNRLVQRPATLAASILFAWLIVLPSTIVPSEGASPARAAEGLDLTAIQSGPPEARFSTQPAVQNALSRRNVWKSFLSRYGTGFVVVWDENSGAPRELYGPPIPLKEVDTTDRQSVMAAAQEFIDQNADLLGVSSSNLELVHAVRGKNLWYVNYRQVISGLPVFQSRVDIRIHQVGAISFVGTEGVVRQAPASMSLQSSPEKAVQILRTALSSEDRGAFDRSTEPIYVRRGRSASPAWLVQLRRDWPRAGWSAVIDDATGEILHVWSDLYHADITGTVRGQGMPGNACSTTAVLPLSGLLVTADGVGSTYTDADGNFTIPYGGTEPVNVTAALTGIGVSVYSDVLPQLAFNAPVTPGVPKQILLNPDWPEEFDVAQINGFYHTMFVHDYLQSILDESAFLDTPLPCRVNINNGCNAYFIDGEMGYFRANFGCENFCFETVVYHEYGHFVDWMLGGITSGALTEGFSDTLCAFASGQPINGECYRGPGTFVRTADNDSVWPAAECADQIHCLGNTFSGFAWDLRENLIASLGQSAGIALAESLIFNSMPANASNIPKQVMAVYFEDDDDADFTNGTPHFDDIAAAAGIHGLPVPVLLDLTFGFTPLPHTFDTENDYPISVYVTSRDSTVTTVTLHYSVDGGPFTPIPLIPGTEPDEFEGVIPTLPCPTTVTYYFSAEDALGHLETWPRITPEIDPFLFYVAFVTPIYFEDFDSASSNGWTHSGSLGTDDWQRGKPWGQSGDPWEAFSGPNCWGNDLGAGSTAGRYPSEADSYLASPAINCTGAEGVRLAYRRWLTVQDGVHDRAYVTVNGTTIWENPAGSGGDHFIDTSWKREEYDISALADGQVIVLSWELEADETGQFGGFNIDDVELFTISCNPMIEEVTTTVTLVDDILIPGDRLHGTIRWESTGTIPVTFYAKASVQLSNGQLVRQLYPTGGQTPTEHTLAPGEWVEADIDIRIPNATLPSIQLLLDKPIAVLGRAQDGPYAPVTVLSSDNEAVVITTRDEQDMIVINPHDALVDGDGFGSESYYAPNVPNVAGDRIYARIKMPDRTFDPSLQEIAVSLVDGGEFLPVTVMVVPDSSGQPDLLNPIFSTSVVADPFTGGDALKSMPASGALTPGQVIWLVIELADTGTIISGMDTDGLPWKTGFAESGYDPGILNTLVGSPVVRLVIHDPN